MGRNFRDELPAKPCEHCEKPIPARRWDGHPISPSNYAKRRFCSPACKYAARKQDRPSLGPCRNCGKEIAARFEGSKTFRPKGTKFCSHACSSLFRRMLPLDFGSCPVCKEKISEFHPNGDRRKTLPKFCSQKCTGIAARRSPEGRVASYPEKHCVLCEEKISPLDSLGEPIPRVAFNQRIFCGMKCHGIARRLVSKGFSFRSDAGIKTLRARYKRSKELGLI